MSFFEQKDNAAITIALIQKEFAALARAEEKLIKKIMHFTKGAEPTELIQQLKSKHELLVREMDKLSDRLTVAEEKKGEMKQMSK